MKKAIVVTALWCPSCLMMRPRYQYVLEYHDIPYQEFDFDLDGAKFASYHIGETIPVLIIFEDEIEIYRAVGEKSMAELMKIVKDV